MQLFDNAIDVCYFLYGSIMNINKVEEFRKYLRSFERILEKQLKNSNCCSGVTLKQCHTLIAINEKRQCTLIELAKLLSLDKSTVSRTIENLNKNDLVRRVINPKNRRESIISLTTNGKKIVDEINNENNRYFGDALKNIPLDKVDQIIESLKILSNALGE